MNVSNRLIFKRLDELFAQSLELADAANAEMIVYLVAMARLELQALRAGNDNARRTSFVAITRRE